MAAFTRRYFSTLVFCSLLIRLGNASRHIFPTSTFAGFRAADNQFEILPTPNPGTLSDISKRYANNPAICGWVEGDDGGLFVRDMIFDTNLTLKRSKVTQSLVVRATFVLQHQPLLAAAPAATPRKIVRYSLQRATMGEEILAMLRVVPTALHLYVLIEQSSDQTRYCAIYRYASGFRGYGCAISTGYNKTVLATTSSSVARPTTFDDPSITSTASTSTIGKSSSTSDTGPAASNSATAVLVKPNSMSGGAVAGIVIGAVAVAAILVIMWLLFQKHRKNQAQQQGNQTYRGSYPLQDQGLYDQYGKLVHSPPWSPQNYFHHQPDGYSELDAGLLSPEPSSHKSSMANPSGISEADGRTLSPETIQDSPPSSHRFSDGGQQNRLVELPVYR
ncbi:hypothetical protein MMC29_003495 [Sticta canariensis]|nr:hypothetical protein [Sticta canariensis]